MAKHLDRTTARRKIIQAANRHRHRAAGTRWPYIPPKVYSARVRVVRTHGLVDAGVLVAAGFRPGGRP